MNTVKPVFRPIMGTVSLFLGIGLLTAAAYADVEIEKVDCDEGETIADALEEDDLDESLVIKVEGTCRETVTITRNDVTLDGEGTAVIDGGGANPEPVLLVDGARRVTIKKLTVRNGSDGFLARGGAAVILEGVTAELNTDDGIVVDENSTAQLTDCTAQKNGNDGINVTRNSDATFTGMITSTDNRDEGIQVFGGSSAVALEGATIWVNENDSDGMLLIDGSNFFFGTNTTVEATGNDRGIAVSRDSSVSLFSIVSGVIENNTGDGLAVSQNSFASIRNTTITGNGLPSPSGGPPRGNGITLSSQSSVNMSDSQVLGNGGSGIFATGSALQIFNAPISGNGLNGITLGLQSSLDMSNSEVSGNRALGVGAANNSSVVLGPGATVSGNRGGILLRFNSSLSMAGSSPTVRDVEVSGNERTGILGLSNGSLEIRNATISDNEFSGIQVQLYSSLQTNNSTISGHTIANGILVTRDSAVELSAGMNFSGNATDIRCGDTESSVIDTATGMPPVGPVVVSCTGF